MGLIQKNGLFLLQTLIKKFCDLKLSLVNIGKESCISSHNKIKNIRLTENFYFSLVGVFFKTQV